MEIGLWIAAAITAVGAAIKILLPIYIKRSLEKTNVPQYVELGDKSGSSELSPVTSLTGATKIVIAFATVVAILGLMTLIRYWEVITRNQDYFYFSMWLFIFMIAGMFVQVLAFNYRGGRALLEVTVSQLVFPILFSVVVFYPIWAIAASAAHSFFSIHAAFLNGYFWESVVSTASPPKSNV